MWGDWQFILTLGASLALHGGIFDRGIKKQNSFLVVVVREQDKLNSTENAPVWHGNAGNLFVAGVDQI